MLLRTRYCWHEIERAASLRTPRTKAFPTLFLQCTIERGLEYFQENKKLEVIEKLAGRIHQVVKVFTYSILAKSPEVAYLFC